MPGHDERLAEIERVRGRQVAADRLVHPDLGLFRAGGHAELPAGQRAGLEPQHPLHLIGRVERETVDLGGQRADRGAIGPGLSQPGRDLIS